MMSYLEANKLLMRVRQERPELFSGTAQIGVDEKGDEIFIGPQDHSAFDPEHWCVHLGRNYDVVFESPAEWEIWSVEYPKDRVARTQPFLLYTGPSTLVKDDGPWPDRACRWVLNKLPRPLANGLIAHVFSPLFEGLTDVLVAWTKLIKHPQWLSDLPLRLSFYIPLYPTFIESSAMADQVVSGLTQVFAAVKEGSEANVFHPAPGMHVVLRRPGGAWPEEVPDYIREAIEAEERQRPEPEG